MINTITTEAQAKEICRTILAQLGGNRFMDMVGGINLGYTIENNGDVSLTIAFKGCKKANKLKITYKAGDDLYDFLLYNSTAKTPYKEHYKREGAYCDMLVELFETNTGLYTTL